MRNYLIYCLLLIINNIYAQFSETFTDGDIKLNPTWQGDTSSFRVDVDKLLRLNATQAGKATIYTPIFFEDSFEIKIDVGLEFNPSATNQANVYFLVDKPQDLAKANGYYISFGENGDQDAIRLLQLKNGVSTLIAKGKDAALANELNRITISVLYRPNKNITVLADHDFNNVFEDTLKSVDKPQITSKVSAYIALNGIFTATRKDKITFDNIFINKLGEDSVPPEVKQATVQNDKQILVDFSEVVLKSSAESISNYEVADFGAPTSAVLDASGTKVLLSFNKTLTPFTTYILNIANVEDKNKNKLARTILQLEYKPLPKIGDLIISEILFDPYTNEEDFIEIYNNATYGINLQGIKIKNITNGQETVYDKKYVLSPKAYVAITKSKASLERVYKPPTTALIIENALPAFNNSDGNATLIYPDGSIADYIDYTDQDHFITPSTKSVDGVSLEKIRLVHQDNTANWVSAAASANYATPGYTNSVSLDLTTPQVTNVAVTAPQKISVTFNDILTKSTAENKANYTVSDNEVVGAVLDLKQPNIVYLTLSKNLSTTGSATLNIKQVTDKAGNAITPYSTTLYYGAAPQKGDLVISEILFAPLSGNDDFVEIYNASSKNITLENTLVKNAKNKQEKVITSAIVMAPNTYMALSPDTAQLRAVYKPSVSTTMLQMSLPSFNVDQGNVMLLSPSRVVLDSFDYHQDMHFKLIDLSSSAGVSLEKLVLKPFENSRSNWHSAAQAVNYATPGYKNSHSVNTDAPSSENITLEKTTFSPNGDGQNDLLIIKYALEEPGYLANISIYNSNGFKIRTLTVNELLGTEGVLTWDGASDSGEKPALGIYIVSGKFYTLDGKTKHFKKQCVVADFID
jgi:hypothetical protein